VARQGHRRRVLAIAVTAVVALTLASSACGGRNSSSSSKAEGASSAGRLPAILGATLAGRDTSLLPAGAFLRFQAIAHGPDPRSNHRWVLYDDGRLYLAFHSADSEGAAPFDTPLPTTPTATLPTTTVGELRALLRADGFASLSPYQAGPRGAEDGMVRVVTARARDGSVHEVVYDRVDNTLLTALQRIGSSAGALGGD
jgi:hypothetical protein